jgi:N-acetylmuramoyl-L-alanine amidase-like protein
VADDFPDAALSPSGTQPTAFIMHHTAGRGDPASVVKFWQQQGKGYGAQYIMDRNGVIHDTAKEFGYGGTNEILNDPGRKLSNSDVVGMEIVANDDADVTPQQAQAAAQFIQARYPNIPVFGHGQVNPGHKEATEGWTAVNAVNALRGGTPGTPLVDARVASTANTASLSPPSRPSSPTPGVTLNTSPMDLVAQVESGNRNIPQSIHDVNTDRGTPAGGYFQIIDPTWARYAGAAGVDVKQYPNAMSAPRDVQAKVAGAIPVNQWGPDTVAALKAQYPNIDTSQTLGAVQSAALGSALATTAAAPAALAAPAVPGTTLPGFPGKAQSDAFTQGAQALDKGMMHGGQSGGEQEGQAAAFQPVQARNVSPLLGQSAQIYGNTLTSMATPLQWGAATPGQSPYANVGGPAPLGTGLNSLAQLQQMMAMYGGGGYG